jgi:ketosteroid isomerase-like protein
MKICPNCHTQYTDDTLRFCLQDGSVLTGGPVTQPPTVSPVGRELEADSVATRWKQDSRETRVSKPESKSGSRLFMFVAGIASLLLFLGGMGAVGLWLYWKDSGPVVTNTNNQNGGQNLSSRSNKNANMLPTSTNTPVVTPTPTATIGNVNSHELILGPAPDVDRDRASAEVSQQVQDWRSSTETGDISSLVRKYAPSVQYYRKSGASPEFIRADKQRAHTMFDSISIRISNMDVSVSGSGETATAQFDKEWVFEGTRRSTGKVRQQLQFSRINGQWLITGERDVRVYYTN